MENSILEFSVLVLPVVNGDQPLAANALPTAVPNAAASPVGKSAGSVSARPCRARAHRNQGRFPVCENTAAHRPSPKPSGAEIAPLVIVARQPAIGRLHVDAGPAAEHAAPARRRARPSACRVTNPPGGCGQPRPDVTVAVEQRHRVAVEDFDRLRAGQGIRAGLDQQHAAGAARRAGGWRPRSLADPPPTMTSSNCKSFIAFGAFNGIRNPAKLPAADPVAAPPASAISGSLALVSGISPSSAHQVDDEDDGGKDRQRHRDLRGSGTCKRNEGRHHAAQRAKPIFQDKPKCRWP